MKPLLLLLLLLRLEASEFVCQAARFCGPSGTILFLFGNQTALLFQCGGLLRPEEQQAKVR